MLTIYGNDHSSCVQKVLWCAEELKLPYRLIEKGGAFGGLELFGLAAAALLRRGRVRRGAPRASPRPVLPGPSTA